MVRLVTSVFCAKEVVVSVTFSVSPESLSVIGLQSGGSNMHINWQVPISYIYKNAELYRLLYHLLYHRCAAV